mmetsp:Transcript_21766/g.54965  ORF Transcript_21766/g.54965 Transcript_21766/m.54965 type:complete len:216 (+) Transcript_21766:824-1471(+)
MRLLQLRSFGCCMISEVFQPLAVAPFVTNAVGVLRLACCLEQDVVEQVLDVLGFLLFDFVPFVVCLCKCFDLGFDAFKFISNLPVQSWDIDTQSAFQASSGIARSSCFELNTCKLCVGFAHRFGVASILLEQCDLQKQACHRKDTGKTPPRAQQHFFLGSQRDRKQGEEETTHHVTPTFKPHKYTGSTPLGATRRHSELRHTRARNPSSIVPFGF